MEKADGLSRRSDWKVEVDRDNKNQIFIKNNWVRSLQEVVIEGLEVELLEKIKKARSKDEEIVGIVENIKRVKVKELQEKEWKIEGKLVLIKEKVYVPKDKELRVEVIWLHHDVPVVGHRGRYKIVELVTRNYWWLEVTRDVERYIEGCNLY